jgi:hypothetical protein
MVSLNEKEVEISSDVNQIERAFQLTKSDTSDICSVKNIQIKNNIDVIKRDHIETCTEDDGYNMGF